MVITPTLSIVEYPNINSAFPSTVGECLQGFYAKATFEITGIEAGDSFGLDMGINLTTVAPLIYSNWTYLANYTILLPDNIGYAGTGSPILGSNGANQSFEYTFGGPEPDIPGVNSSANVAFIFFGNNTDLTSSAVIAKYYTGTSGQTGFFMNLPPGRTFSLTPYYRIYRFLDGFGPRISFASASVSVPVLPCEDGGGGGDACPCEWTPGTLPTTTWARQATNCASWTGSTPPTTAWTKRGCP